MQNVPNQIPTNLQDFVAACLAENNFAAAMQACRAAISAVPNNIDAYKQLDKAVNAAAKVLSNQLDNAIRQAESNPQPDDMENRNASVRQAVDELTEIYTFTANTCNPVLFANPYKIAAIDSLNNAFCAVSPMLAINILRNAPMSDYMSEMLDNMHRLYPIPHLAVFNADEYIARTHYILPEGIHVDYIVAGSPELQFLPEFIGEHSAAFEIERKFPELCGRTFAVDFSRCHKLGELSSTFFQGCPGLTYIDLSGCTLERIKSNTFSESSALAGVRLPQCLQIIGCLSFNMTGLTQLDIASTHVIYIEDRAFNYATCLESVNLPDTLESIGEQAFTQCYKLNTVVFPQNLSRLGNFAFKDANGLKKVDMARCNLHEIPEGAFLDCKNLERVDNIQSIQVIGPEAFSGCNLKALDFSESEDLQTVIYPGAFANNNNLKSVCFEGLTVVHPYAFSGCMNLTDVHMEDIFDGSMISSKAFSETGLKKAYAPCIMPLLYLENVELTLPSLRTPEYPLDYFADCEGSHVLRTLKKIFPNDIAALSKDARHYSKQLKINPVAEIFKRLKNIDPSNPEIYYDSARCSLKMAEAGRQERSIREQEYHALLENALTDVNTAVRNMQMHSAEENGGLPKVAEMLKLEILPRIRGLDSSREDTNTPDFMPPLKRGRLYINNYALFAKPREIIPGLHIVVAPTYLNRLAVEGNPTAEQLLSVYKKPDNIAVPDEACYIIYGTPELSDLTDFRLSDWLKNYPDVSFQKTAIDLSRCANLTSIPENTFSFAKNIIDVNLSGCAKLTDIGESAFAGCSSLSNVEFPKNACKFIAPFAFQGTGITELKLADTGLVTIGDGAFNLCRNLKCAQLPDGICHIGNSAFSMCSNLEQINIPQSISSLGCYSFYNTGIKQIDLLNTKISIIPEGAFDAALKLQRAVLPESLTGIGYASFYRCAALEELVLPCPEKLSSVGDYAFMHSGLQSLDLSGASIKNVSKGAFAFCRRLQAVSLPQCIMRIDDGGFAECHMLSELKIPKNSQIKGLGAYALCGNGMEFIDFADTPIDNIEHHAFAHSYNAKAIILPQQLRQIGHSVFADCHIEQPILIPNTLRRFHDQIYTPELPVDKIYDLEHILLGIGSSLSPNRYSVSDDDSSDSENSAISYKDGAADNSFSPDEEFQSDTCFSWPLSYKKFYREAQELLQEDDMVERAAERFATAAMLRPADNIDARLQSIMCDFYAAHYHKRYIDRHSFNESPADVLAAILENCMSLPQTPYSCTPINLICARIFADLSNYPDAISRFDQIVRTNTQENKVTPDNIYIERARCKYVADYPQTDIENDYKLAIQSNPNGSMPYYEFGRYYMMLAIQNLIDGKQEESVQMYRNASAMLSEAFAHKDDVPENDFNSYIDDNVNFNEHYYNSTVKDFLTSAFFPDGRTVGSILTARAEAYIGTKEYDNAIADCKNALASNNHEPMIYVLLAEAQLGAQRYDDVIRTCKKAEEQGFSHSSFSPMLMEAYIAMQNYMGATSECARTIAAFQNKNSPLADRRAAVRVNVQLRIESPEGMEDYINAASESADTMSAKLSPADCYILGRVCVLQAFTYFSLGKYQSAAEFAEKAIGYCQDYTDMMQQNFNRDTPANINNLVLAHSIHAKSRLNKQCSDGVFEDCEQILKYCPDNVDVPVLHGIANFINQDYENAVADFNNAILNAPSNNELLLMRAKSFIGKQDYDSAIVDCNTAIMNDMFSAEPFVVRAKAHIGNNNFVSAVGDCDMAINNTPSNAEAFTVRAEARLKLQDYDGALADCRSAVNLGGNTVENMFNFVKAYRGKNDNNSAIMYCNEILNTCPKNKDALLIRADINHSTRNYAESLADYKEIAKLYPDCKEAAQQIHILQLEVQQAARQINNPPAAVPQFLPQQLIAPNTQHQDGKLPSQTDSPNRERTGYKNFADEQQNNRKINPAGNHGIDRSNAKDQDYNAGFGKK